MNNNILDQLTLEEDLVSRSQNKLEARGKTIRLQPKVMEVLNYLARHYDRVIPKEELVENVWPGRVVTHGSVQKSINLLRKSLTELMGERDLIVHYSKKGYQLQVQPVFLESQDRTSTSGRSGLLPSRLLEKRVGGLVIVAVVILFGLAYAWLNRHTLVIHKSHSTEFQSIQGYTSE